MSDLRNRVAAFARTLPEGEQRRKILKILASSLETYRTEEGTEFKIRTTDFANFLQEHLYVRPGPAMGAYLREEKRVEDRYLDTLRKRYKAKVKGAPRKPRDPYAIREKGPNINRLWDMLIKAIWKQLEGYGADAGDYFVNMPASYSHDEFPQYIAGISGDLSLNWEYDLGPRARKWWDKLALAMQTGIYKGRGYEKWDLRHRKQLLGEIYADAWNDAMMKGWEALKRDPTEMARLEGMRPTR